MAKGGRVVLGRDGKPKSQFHLDPHQGGHDPADVKAAHGYAAGAGQAFKALSPDELKARRIPAPSGGAQAKPAAKAADTMPVAKAEAKPGKTEGETGK